MEDKIYLEWENVYLCSGCGGVTNPHGYKVCPSCGAVGWVMAPHIQTSRRFVITEKSKWYNPFSRDKGYYEYSGKLENGSPVGKHLMKGKAVSNHIATIAAAGVASGLF